MSSTSSSASLGLCGTQPPQATDEDMLLVRQTSYLISTLQQRPMKQIIPYAEHLHMLSERLETLSQSLVANQAHVQAPQNSEGSTLDQPTSAYDHLSDAAISTHQENLNRPGRLGNETVPSPSSSLLPFQCHSSVQELPPTAITLPRSSLNHAVSLGDRSLRYNQSAAEALNSATRQIPALENVVQRIISLPTSRPSWLQQDTRIAHLQPVSYLAKRKSSHAIPTHDRLLLMFSCYSLAQDFRCFERAKGWKPKEDQIIARILRHQDPATQSIGKHSQHFLCSYSALSADREKVDSGLRLGTKLRVMDAITNTLQIGCGLSLLFGYEHQKLSRLNYNVFPAIMQILEGSEEQRKILRRFSDTTGSWLTKTRAQYHQIYGMISQKHHF